MHSLFWYCQVFCWSWQTFETWWNPSLLYVSSILHISPFMSPSSHIVVHKSDCNLKFWTWCKVRIKLRSWREFMMSISKRTLETILLNLLNYLKDSRWISILSKLLIIQNVFQSFSSKLGIAKSGTWTFWDLHMAKGKRKSWKLTEFWPYQH